MQQESEAAREDNYHNLPWLPAITITTVNRVQHILVMTAIYAVIKQATAAN